MIDMRIIFMKYFIFKRPAMIFGLAFICYFILAQASEARTNLLIVDESQQYQGIGKDFYEAAKTRLSRMGYTILNKTKKLQALGIIENSVTRNSLLQSNAIRIAADEVIILFTNVMVSRNKIRVSAEAYSVAAQSFILSWSLPSEELYVPENCDEACLRINNDRLISRLGEEIGDSIGNMLARENGVTDESGQTIAAIEIELIDFTENEKLQLLDLMTNEFPKFYRVSKTRIYGPRHTLTYHSSANLMDLHKWILVSLKQIGLTPDVDFDLIISAGRIDIRKNNIMLIPKNQTGDTLRFN